MSGRDWWYCFSSNLIFSLSASARISGPGFVRQDFIEMARKPNRTEEEEVILAQMKRDMAKRLLDAKPEEVYDAVIL